MNNQQQRTFNVPFDEISDDYTLGENLLGSSDLAQIKNAGKPFSLIWENVEVTNNTDVELEVALMGDSTVPASSRYSKKIAAGGGSYVFERINFGSAFFFADSATEKEVEFVGTPVVGGE